MTTILEDAESMHALVDKCLRPYAYSLAELDTRNRCDVCDRPANTTVYSNRTVTHYCEDHAPKEESEGPGDDEYNRRQYERHGPDGGI